MGSMLVTRPRNARSPSPATRARRGMLSRSGSRPPGRLRETGVPRCRNAPRPWPSQRRCSIAPRKRRPPWESAPATSPAVWDRPKAHSGHAPKKPAPGRGHVVGVSGVHGFVNECHLVLDLAGRDRARPAARKRGRWSRWMRPASRSGARPQSRPRPRPPWRWRACCKRRTWPPPCWPRRWTGGPGPCSGTWSGRSRGPRRRLWWAPQPARVRRGGGSLGHVEPPGPRWKRSRRSLA